MKILIVGNGGREHTIAWKLAQSPLADEILVAPGNAGTAQVGDNVPINADDIGGLLGFAKAQGIDFTVIGPEAPLAAGIVDRFQDAGLLAFGPTKAAARIETSKSFAKDLMLRHDVPTGKAVFYEDFEGARRHLENTDLPVVVKADGLAAGKGVVVAETREDAIDALRGAMLDKQFGAAGERVLIEEYLEGREISVFAFVDGERLSSLVAACDYKRAGDGDTGPNTGGIGSYSPPIEPMWSVDMEHRVRTEIMEPVVKAMAEDGTPYSGVLYAGLMVTADGPKVIEFNCRLGDPETQVILPRLKSDLLDVMLSTARGNLAATSLEWEPQACVGVVMASGGYPESYETGYPIDGLDNPGEDVYIFHAGTKIVPDPIAPPAEKIVSDGGRVLTVTALGDTLAEARRKAYSGATGIRFKDCFYRRDIALLEQKE